MFDLKFALACDANASKKPLNFELEVILKF